jgi:hypothetical protein
MIVIGKINIYQFLFGKIPKKNSPQLSEEQTNKTSNEKTITN